MTTITDNEQRIKEQQANSHKNDIKKHADSIINELKKLNDTAKKRAIWELFQNALDMSDSNAEIQIEYGKKGMIFRHNGKPFSPNSLDCLVKQVSDKDPDKEKKGSPVGQYGTGFITTHCYGLKIYVSGSLSWGDGYLPLDSFLLDRSAPKSIDLAVSIETQLRALNEIYLQNNCTPNRRHYTEFAYEATDKDHLLQAENTIKDICAMLPYVMTINSKLKKVTTIDKNGTKKEFNRIVDDSGSVTIQEDNSHQLSLLEDSNAGITVILPITSTMRAFSLENTVTRLFLFYPLIKTESFGINYIIHSDYFIPTMDRDGLFIASDIRQVQESEKQNQEQIKIAGEMIFGYLKANLDTITNRHCLAKVNFAVNNDNPHLDEYYLKLKRTWLGEFTKLKFVRTSDGHIAPVQAMFFTKDLVEYESFEAIYRLATMFWSNLPECGLCKEWTKIVDEWGEETDLKRLTINELVSKIEEKAVLTEFNVEDLQAFYRFLIANDKSGSFSDHKLLPNINGRFATFQELKQRVNFLPKFIPISEIIRPDIGEKLVDDQFLFDLMFEPYPRKKLSAELNEKIVNFVSDDYQGDELERGFLVTLIEYCRMSALESESVPTKIVDRIAEYYRYTFLPIEFAGIKDDILDNRAAQKKLLRIFLNEIAHRESDWVEDNTQLIHDVVSLGAKHYDYIELFSICPVIPNQLNKLCIKGKLQIDDKIPDEIKDMYDGVVSAEGSIRGDLAKHGFEQYLKEAKKTSAAELVDAIENKFSEDGQYNNVRESNYKDEIVKLIKKQNEHVEWAEFFKKLNARRANVMLELINSKNIRNEVHAILSLKDEQIKKLGELAGNNYFDEIIKLGYDALEEKQRNSAVTIFKQTIGTHLEDVLRQRLAEVIPEEIFAKPESEQDGQDIVIYIKGKPVYYLEVKSKWRSDTKITMSKNQTICAYRNSDQYSLCVIEMVDYPHSDKYQVKEIDRLRPFMRFNFDIGKKVKHLIDTLERPTDPNEIHLDGDLRTFIPKSHIDSGKRLDVFEGIFIDKVRAAWTKLTDALVK